MKLVCDCHIHTISSGHAYSTVTECAKAAQQKGLELIAITDHASALPGSPHIFHFQNMKVLPEKLFGVKLLRGAEVNILDFNGQIDMPEDVMDFLDIVIASLHQPCYSSGTRKENTKAVIKTMQNKYVDVIGHPDDGRMPLDYYDIVQAAIQTGTLLEINNSSLMPMAFRQNAKQNDEEMLSLAVQYGARIIVDSDAHYHDDVGNFSEAMAIIQRMGVPEELIANISPERLLSWLKK